MKLRIESSPEIGGVKGCDGMALVVTHEQENVLGISQFQAKQVVDVLHGLRASIDIVAEKYHTAFGS